MAHTYQSKIIIIYNIDIKYIYESCSRVLFHWYSYNKCSSV